VRSQLLVAGLVIMAMGALFYALQLPLIYFWSIPFLIGGGIMAAASPFLSEWHGPVQPPEGYRFCIFCSIPVELDEARCPRCNGVQPKVER
jgi:hypothetical protein